MVNVPCSQKVLNFPLGTTHHRIRMCSSMHTCTALVVCAIMCVCVCVCVRACERVCVCMCMCVCACLHAYECEGMCFLELTVLLEMTCT